MDYKLGLFLTLTIHVIDIVSPIVFVHHGPVHGIQPIEILKPFSDPS